MLGAALCLQAALLFTNLGLLPVWTDELFTLSTAPRPISEILSVTRSDIHPPLYFVLLHGWPWHTLEGMRAFSALWALGATFLLDRLWTSRWRTDRRAAAVFLFSLSPCLLLYGRMARSYAMQTALAVLAVRCLWRWQLERRGAWMAWAASLALLYTHYVPGLALLAAFVVAGWRVSGWRRAAGFSVAVLAGYLPWLATLAGALRRWGEASGFSSRYLLTGSPWAEQALKAAYGAVSLAIGESFYSGSLLVVPLAAWLAWRGGRMAARSARVLVPTVGGAAVAGYLGVSRWVSFPFVPARMLWLLPFLMLAVAIGIGRRRWIGAVLLVSSAGSIVCYFRQENYLNKSYAAPLREIAGRLNREAAPADLILMDAYNTDGEALRYYLSGRTRAVSIRTGEERGIARDAASAPTVWVVRNQRDISPGKVTGRTVDEACAARRAEEELYLPYSWWERAVLGALAGQAPTHFYQLLVCSAAPTPPG